MYVFKAVLVKIVRMFSIQVFNYLIAHLTFVNHESLTILKLPSCVKVDCIATEPALVPTNLEYAH